MARAVPSPVQAIHRAAGHTLFVEGKFDADVLNEFFKAHPLGDNLLHVEPFGPSFSIRAAAEALHRHHREYYFLIDRDHCDDAEVARSWENFPGPATKNILVWRRRELENYFLIPEYLLRSPHLHRLRARAPHVHPRGLPAAPLPRRCQPRDHRLARGLQARLGRPVS